VEKNGDRRGRRIFFIFLWIYLLVALGILSAGWYYYQGQVQKQRLLMEQQLSGVADIKVKDILRWKRERFGEANVLFNHLTFSKLVRRYFENPRDTGLQKELWSWLHQIRIGQDFEALFLMDADGRVRISVPEQSKTACPTLQEKVSEAIKTHREIWVDFHRDGPDQPPVLGVVLPIRDMEGSGRVLGVLVMRIDPQAGFYPLLQRWPIRSRTYETQLVRREGNEVVFLNDLRFQKNAALNLRLPLDRKEIPAVQAVLGREGIFEGKAIRGVPVLTALRTVPDTPWHIVVKLDLEEVYEPLRERLWTTILFIGLLLLALGAGLGLTWRHLRSVYYRERFQTAEALRLQEKRLSLVAEHFPGLMSHIDRDLRYLYVNSHYEKVFGKIEGGWVGRTVLQALGEEGYARVAPLIQRALAGEQITFENTVRTEDGGVFHGLFTFIPDRNPEGEVVGYYLFGTDITDRKRAEDELKRMNRLFGALSQVNQVVVRVRSHRDLFTAVCRVLVEFGDFKLAWIGWIVPQENRLEISSWAGQGGGFLEGLEIPCQDPQGRFGPLIPAINSGRTFISADFRNTVFEEAAREVGFRAMAAMPLKRGGEVVGLLVIHEENHDFFRLKETDLLEEVAGDISFALDHLAEEEARRRMEDELRRSEERYRTILEEIDEGYYETDLRGNYTFVNQSEARGKKYSKEELIGMNYRVYTPKEKWEDVRRAFNQVYTTGQPIKWLPVTNICKDGEIRWFEEFVSCLRDKTGRVVGFRGISRDVTERKRAEEKVKETLEQLQNALDATIQVMSAAVEARDPYTAGHQRRTTTLALALGREMGLPEEKLEGLRLAAAIHDIGKLSVPAEILSKPTTLTNIEFALIKTHPQNGYDILKNVSSPWPLAEIVLQHHERLNGSGYPQGLQGEAILPEARILAVADVVEAIASHRPYRPALGIEQALEEIEKQKGILFDAQVVEACLKLFREQGFRFE